jgi:hypothetical protein
VGSIPHHRGMSEVMPMGRQVVYVCVGWCDHVWNLISNLSNQSYLSYAASLRKLKKIRAVSWGLSFDKKLNVFFIIPRIRDAQTSITSFTSILSNLQLLI